MPRHRQPPLGLGQRAGLDRAGNFSGRAGLGCGIEQAQRSRGQTGGPLHPVARLSQPALDRCLADPRLGLFAAGDLHLAFGVEEAHLAGQHGQHRATIGIDLERPFGAADRRGCRRGGHHQSAGRFARIRPGAATLQIDHPLAAGRLWLDLQLAVRRELELGLIDEQEAHPAGIAGAHEIAPAQPRADRCRLPIAGRLATRLAAAFELHHLGQPLGGQRRPAV